MAFHAGVFTAVVVLLAGFTYSHEYLADEEDEEGRFLVISTTGDNAFPSFPSISIGALTDANVTVGLGAALLAGLAIAGLTAATITLAILLGIEVKKDKKYDYDYDYGSSGSSPSSYSSGPSSYDVSSYSIKRSLEEAAKKYL